MKILLVICFSCYLLHLSAQQYQDASNQLPNAGTLSPTMDIRAIDLDQDGDLDLIFCSEDDVTFGLSNVHEFYLNNGAATFTAAPYSFPDSKANAVVAEDINGDNFPDVFFGNDGQNFCLINQQDGTFTNETSIRLPQLNDTTQDLIFADLDQDQDQDLIVGNEDGNRILINDGNGFFRDETANRYPVGLNIETRKVTVGDIDGDQDLDLFLSNVQFIPGKNRQNRLLLNDGTGKFSDVTAAQLPADGDDTLDAIFEDVDLDNDLDLILANVNLQTFSRLEVYLNDGQGTFSDETNDILPKNYFINALGVIAADLNGDQLNDLYFCDRNTNNQLKDVLLLRQPLSTSTETGFSLPPSFQLYPNPSRGQLILEGRLSKEAKISLLSTLDQSITTLFPKVLTPDRHRLFASGTELNHLSPGLYYVCLEEGNLACLPWIKE